MSADLAVYTASDSALDRLDREAVVALLERGKTWLTMAVERDTEIGEFVEFKGQAETVRVYTVQKQLGKDAELAAAELVRRAERGIGLAIRKGQETGAIAAKGEHTFSGNQHGRVAVLPEKKKTSPAEFFNGGDDAVKTYAVTDGVTDDQFDAAIEEAKTEGNLSRANVVRKVTRVQRASYLTSRSAGDLAAATGGPAPLARRVVRRTLTRSAFRLLRSLTR